MGEVGFYRLYVKDIPTGFTFSAANTAKVWCPRWTTEPSPTITNVRNPRWIRTQDWPLFFVFYSKPYKHIWHLDAELHGVC